MATGHIRIVSAVPGSKTLGAVLEDFAKGPSGFVTAFSESILLECVQLLGEDPPVEVVSFAEIVRNYLVQCGEEVLPLSQSGIKRSAIGYACSQIVEGSPFYRCRNFPGFHEAVERTLEELHLWGIDRRTMEIVGSQASPRLQAKLTGLADIDRVVADVNEKLGSQTHTEQIRGCLDSIFEREGDLDRVLVLAGSSPDPIRIEWLKWLAGHGIEITIVLDRHAKNGEIFEGAKQIAETLGTRVKSAGDGNRLLNNLFADSDTPGRNLVISQVSASDPLSEVEWALRGCLDLGSPDRTGIYVRDLESYAPFIESAANRLGVKIRLWRRAPLLTNSFARLTLAALEFCASNDVRTLTQILRSSYVRLSGSEQNEVESRLKDCYRERKGQWRSLEEWAEEQADRFGWLVSILEWRKAAIEDTFSLSERFGMLQKLNRTDELPWVKLDYKGGLMDERDFRASTQMERLLANYISVDRVTVRSALSLREFVELCTRLWTDGDVSIPTPSTGVRVTADPTRLGDVDHLFVLGMLEGIFPRRRSEDPILTDSERLEIDRLRPEGQPLPNSHSRAREERDEFYRVCAAADKEITFSYPRVDDERENIPAFYLKEVERSVGGEGSVHRHDFARRDLAPPTDECKSEADKDLRAAIDGARVAPMAIELTTEVVKNAIKPPVDAAFRPTVLRDAFQCPFQYLVRHSMHLRVKRQTARWNYLRSLPQAALLLTTDDLSKAESALTNALEAELDRIYADVPDWEMKLLRSGGRRLIRTWIKREALSRVMWRKDAGSVLANVSFGTHGTRDVIRDGVKLEGVLAGISKLDGYNVAHLYGAAPASEGNKLTEAEALFYGLHILALYEPGRGSAIEIETAGSKRRLLVLGRGASRSLASKVEEGLQVVDLAGEDDVVKAKGDFFKKVKASLAIAIQRITDGQIDAIPGDQCDRCDFGELCRASKNFSEDDSPTHGEEDPFDV